MALDKRIYEYYLRNFLNEKGMGMVSDRSNEIKLLKKIDKQTSDTQSIIQNVAGNFISDSVIFILKKVIFR